MTQKRYTIGFIGNFIPPYSTENDRKWSFEKLGHEVVEYQENQTKAEQLLEDMNQLDILVYSHTHDPSYNIKDLINVFNIYKANNVPTVSVHLDRWAWLKREEDIGKEATWFTEYIFMADGSPEAVELYKKHNLNWYWLKPGVVERDCKIMQIPTVDNKRLYEYYDIVFTGSRGYHPEYSFRHELVDFLKKIYGNKFGHFGNDGIKVAREIELNELYTSAKIVVGDSCFGGRPNYVSDRYYEVRGRGGFLLHPKTVGVDDVGVGHYASGNLVSLKLAIDYYLENSDEREAMRKAGHEHVKNNETYTHRSQEMLDVIFG